MNNNNNKRNTNAAADRDEVVIACICPNFSFKKQYGERMQAVVEFD